MSLLNNSHVKVVFQLLLLFTLVSSCADNNGLDEKSSSELVEVEEEFVIRPDKTILDGGQLVTFRKDNLYYRSRPFSGSIQRVDVNSGTVKNFMLPSEGPNAVRRINSFLITNEEDMVVFSEHSIYRYKLNGELEKSTRFYPSGEDLKLISPYIIRVDANHPVFEYENKYLVSLERGDADKFSFPYQYEGNVFGLIDVENKKVEVLPIEWEGTTFFYGGLHAVHATLVGDVLNYGFNYSPNLYTYNMSTEGSSKKVVAPIFGKKNEPFYGASDPSETILHMGKSITYGDLRFDSENGLYYQMCLVPVPEGELGFGRARWRAIRVFSKEFELIGDLQLPGYYMDETIFQQGKFFVRYTKDVEENILLYKGFEVKSQL